MHIYYDLKDMLHAELSDIVKKGELSAGSLETVDKLLNSIKNACKIIMYDEYADDGYSYADADSDMGTYSYARGRGSGAKRDSMGRYSRTGGGRYSRRGYSYADDKMSILKDMMNDTQNEDERRVIEKIMHRMERG